MVMNWQSSMLNKSRHVNPVRGRTGNLSILLKKGENAMFKSNSSRLSLILDEFNPSELDKCKSKSGASVSYALVLIDCSLG